MSSEGLSIREGIGFSDAFDRSVAGGDKGISPGFPPYLLLLKWGSHLTSIFEGEVLDHGQYFRGSLEDFLMICPGEK